MPQQFVHPFSKAVNLFSFCRNTQGAPSYSRGALRMPLSSSQRPLGLTMVGLTMVLLACPPLQPTNCSHNSLPEALAAEDLPVMLCFLRRAALPWVHRPMSTGTMRMARNPWKELPMWECPLQCGQSKRAQLAAVRHKRDNRGHQQKQGRPSWGGQLLLRQRR